MSKVPGPPPAGAKRRRNKDELAPIKQGTRRGITIDRPQPSSHWRMDVRNYFNSVLSSAASDWYENSDLMWLTVHCELLDRILRGGRYVPVYKEEKNDEGKYVPIMDEDGELVPELDEFGEPQMRMIGNVNGQALRSVLDMGTELLVTEGSRRRLRIDLANPESGEEPRHKAIVAKQRAELHKVLTKT